MAAGRTASATPGRSALRLTTSPPKAAERAAREQTAARETTVISYEDSGGEWHREISPGDDRPSTDLEG